MKFNLFKKKDKTMDGKKAKVLDKPKLVSETKMDFKSVDEIIKTTDSMRVTSSTMTKDDNAKIGEASKALLRSYDLATRKITSTYDEIIETKKVITNEFLTVQLLITEFESASNIEHIADVVNYFTDEIEAQLAFGKSVKISERILIDPADYVGKMIPDAKMVEPGYESVNTVP